MSDVPAFRVKPRTACLDVVYCVNKGVATNDEQDAILRITPRVEPRSGFFELTGFSCCSFMARDITLVRRKVPLTFTSRKRLNSGRDASAISAATWTPIYIEASENQVARRWRESSYSSRIHHVINSSKRLLRLCYHGFHLLLIGHVEGQYECSICRVCCQFLAFFGCLLSALSVQIGKDNASSSFRSKGQRAGPANPAP